MDNKNPFSIRGDGQLVITGVSEKGAKEIIEDGWLVLKEDWRDNVCAPETGVKAEYRHALAEPQGDGWMPIETAPKKKSVMLLTKYGLIYCGRYRYGVSGEPSQDELAWRCDSSGRFTNPTHWRPLPPLPKE